MSRGSGDISPKFPGLAGEWNPDDDSVSGGEKSVWFQDLGKQDGAASLASEAGPQSEKNPSGTGRLHLFAHKRKNKQKKPHAVALLAKKGFQLG